MLRRYLANCAIKCGVEQELSNPQVTQEIQMEELKEIQMLV